MLKKELRVSSTSGLHARSAQVIVETVNSFEARVVLVNENAEADGSSILELMMLAAAPGSSVQARVEGPDEVVALKSLEKLFENNFYKDGKDAV